MIQLEKTDSQNLVLVRQIPCCNCFKGVVGWDGMRAVELCVMWVFHD